MMSTLYQANTPMWISIVQTTETTVHETTGRSTPHILPVLRAMQSLLLIRNDACLAENSTYQMYSLWLYQTMQCTRECESTHHYTTVAICFEWSPATVFLLNYPTMEIFDEQRMANCFFLYSHYTLRWYWIFNEMLSFFYQMCCTVLHGLSFIYFLLYIYNDVLLFQASFLH